MISTLKGHEEFLLDKDGKIISTNLEAVNITGYEEYEVIGQDLSLFYIPEEKDKANDDLKRAVSLNGIIVTGLRVKKRGGTFWAKMKIRYSQEKNSRSFFKVTLQDATHRVLSNMRVKSIRDEYLAIFNTPFIGVFKFRMSDYMVTMCNKKALEITQQSDSDHFRFNSVFRQPATIPSVCLAPGKGKESGGISVFDQRHQEPEG